MEINRNERHRGILLRNTSFVIVGYTLPLAASFIAAALHLSSISYFEILVFASAIFCSTAMFWSIIKLTKIMTPRFMSNIYYGQFIAWLLTYIGWVLVLREIRTVALFFSLIALTFLLSTAKFIPSIIITVCTALIQVTASYYGIYYLNQAGSFESELFYTICFIPSALFMCSISERFGRQRAETKSAKQIAEESRDALAVEINKVKEANGALNFALIRQRELTQQVALRTTELTTAQSEAARAESEYHRELAASAARRALILQENNETLKHLGLVGQEITAQRDAGSIFSTLDRHVHRLLDATRFSIFLVVNGDTELECCFGSEDARNFVPVRISLTDTTSNVARCARERSEILHTSPIPTEHHADSGASTPPILSAMFSPLIVAERLLGVMSIQSLRGDAYQERELQVLRSLGAYAAISLDNAVAYRRIAETLRSLRETQSQLIDKNAQLEIAYRDQKFVSLTDPLTGMHNRRFLVEQMEKQTSDLELQSLLKRRTTDGVLVDREAVFVFYMIDVDHFKLVNDSYGHAVGDKILIQLRQRLALVARPADYLIRWGGEEFLLVSKIFDRQDASSIAERVRRVVCDTPFDLGDGLTLHKTCSIGFSSFPFYVAGSDTLIWSQVVDIADRALYLAKSAGRNQWIGLMAPPGPPSEGIYNKIMNHLDESIEAGDVSRLRRRP